MIQVNINYRDDCIVSFSVEGHAGFADSGSDIYCAAVSAVTQTALLGLLDNLEATPEYTVEKGRLQCRLPQALSQRDRERAQVILSTMESGLTAMRESCAEYLQIRVRRL
ncbi:MAG TPA: ribosomal-processing cysteine protease Prp [Syntrophomonadaceae bacterium]|nr:ribosomal-processing cysteine protease Prp [Syntrophomonadaceae bacterium]